MKDVLVWGLGVVLGLVLMFGVAFAVTGTDFFMYRWSAPAYEQTRRETFEQTKSYNEGMAQEIQAAQLQYVTAAPEQKKAIASIILHKTAGYDVNRLPPDTRAFVVQLRTERMSP